MSAENLETLCNDDTLNNKSSPDSKDAHTLNLPNADPNN